MVTNEKRKIAEYLNFLTCRLNCPRAKGNVSVVMATSFIMHATGAVLSPVCLKTECCLLLNKTLAPQCLVNYNDGTGVSFCSFEFTTAQRVKTLICIRSQQSTALSKQQQKKKKKRLTFSPEHYLVWHLYSFNRSYSANAKPRANP